MLLSEKIAEVEATGAKVIVQQKRVVSDGVHVVDAYVFLPSVDGVRQTEKVQFYVAGLDTVDESADYIKAKPSVLTTPAEPTPIGTDEELLAATAVKWVKYEVIHQEGQATVNGYVSLSEKEVVYQSWIVQSEKGTLTAYQQKA